MIRAWYEPSKDLVVRTRPSETAIPLMPMPYPMTDDEVKTLLAELRLRVHARTAGVDDRAADRARRAWAGMHGRFNVGPWSRLPLAAQNLWRAVARAVKQEE